MRRTAMLFLAAMLCLLTSCQSATTPEIPWLQANAVPFTSLSIGSGCDDLQPLLDSIGDARIVGLGEATHGTREFYQFKARLVECLVTEKGFNILAMEAGWSEARALDASLQEVDSDPGELLPALAGWIYDTQEVLDLLTWIQHHNLPLSDPTSILHLRGLDMQYPNGMITSLLSYVSATRPADLDLVQGDLACFTQNVFNPQVEPNAPLYSQADPPLQETCQAGLLSIQNRLVANQTQYVSASGPQAFTDALETVVLLKQSERLFAEPIVGNQIALRDGYMADNASRFLEQAGPGAKIILWAHNGHVRQDTSALGEKEAPLYGLPPGTMLQGMGARLRVLYGEEYRAVGFAFHHGSFNAFGYQSATGAATTFGIYTLEGPLPGDLEEKFHEAGYPQFYLDLGRLQADPAAPAWLTSPGRITSFGAGYTTDDPQVNTETLTLPEAYSILVYFDSTTASQMRWGGRQE